MDLIVLPALITSFMKYVEAILPTASAGLVLLIRHSYPLSEASEDASYLADENTCSPACYALSPLWQCSFSSCVGNRIK
jgi:hypothetical protein